MRVNAANIYGSQSLEKMQDMKSSFLKPFCKEITYPQQNVSKQTTCITILVF